MRAKKLPFDSYLHFGAGITASVYTYFTKGKLSLKYRGFKISLKTKQKQLNKKTHNTKLNAEILHALGVICWPDKYLFW